MPKGNSLNGVHQLRYMGCDPVFGAPVQMLGRQVDPDLPEGKASEPAREEQAASMTARDEAKPTKRRGPRRAPASARLHPSQGS